MGKEDFNNIIAALDIGTTKVCAIIGEVSNDDVVHIVGVGNSPSRGLIKGVVVNIEDTVNSIKNAINDASRMAGVEIGAVYAGIAGGHIKGMNSHGVIAVSGTNKEVTEEDIERVIDAAKAVIIPMDRELIHVIPQEFIIDGQDGIKDPIGMSGVRLEAEVHIVTGAVTSAQNIVKSVEKGGFYVEDIVLQPLASSEAVLTQDEKDLGVALIDIGGGTSDIIIYADGGIRHTAVLSIGGNLITRDIAIGLKAPAPASEELKKKYGCALASLVDDDEIVVPGVGGRGDRNVPRRELASIIQPRVEEIFELARQEIDKNGFTDKIPAGIVITGGTALLEGIAQVAENIHKMPARIGVPIKIEGLTDVVQSPIYATGVGLVLYGKKHRSDGKGPRFGGENVFNRVLRRMREWFSEFF